MRRVFSGASVREAAGYVLLLGLICLLSACGGGEKEQLSEDGLRYTASDGAVTITGYEGEAAEVAVPDRLGDLPVTAVARDAFPGTVVGVSLPKTVQTVEKGAFSGKLPPRYILLEGEDTQMAEVPEESLLLRVGQQLETGRLSSVFLDELQALYGVTDGGAAELLRFPTDFEVYEVPGGLEREHPYVYVSAAALEEWPQGEMLVLGEQAVVAADRMTALKDSGVLRYPEDSLAADWALSVEAAEQVNGQRESLGLDPISADVEVVRAARARMKELSEAYSLDRPDGSPGVSVLEEEKIPFQMFTAVIWRGNTLEQCGETAVNHALEYSDRDQNGVLYDTLGMSAGYGVYEGEDVCFLNGIYLNTTMEELVVGSLTYAIEEDHAELSAVAEGTTGVILHEKLYGKPVTDIRQGAFAQGDAVRYVVVPSGISYLDSKVFEGCDNLRAVLMPDGFALGGRMPGQCRTVAKGLDTGDGRVVSLNVDEQGGVYAFTDQWNYVLYDIPEKAELFTVPRQLGGYPVTLIYSSAVKEKPNLEALGFYWNCGIDPEALDELKNCSVFVYSQERTALDSGQLGNTMYGATILSVSLAEQINEIRAAEGEGPVRADYEAIRAAWVMVQEQAEQYSQTRPDGRKWTSVFEDEGIENWGHARMSRDVLYTSADVSEAIRSFARDVAPEEDGFYYHNVGMAICSGTHEGRQAVFFYGLAYEGEE